MQLLSDTSFLLHSSSIFGRKAILCLFLNHTNSDSHISWADSVPCLGCPCNRSYLRIHAVILIKRCQVSYLVANAVLSSTGCIDIQNNLHVVLLAFLFLLQLNTLDLLVQASHGLASNDKIALTIEDHSTKVRFP